MILAAVCGGLFQNLKLQISSLGILCGIVLRLLFEIHARSELSVKPIRFAGIAEACPEMKICLLDAFKHHKYIEIQWIGMTMFNVWNTMESVFDWLATSERVPDVRFQVAMLEGAWLDAHHINDAWTGEIAQGIAKRINKYPEHHIGAHNWKFEVQRYAHMPAVHGGLINGKYLFLGICQWEEGTLKAGDRLYELYTFRDGEDSTDKIEVFRNWFHFCFNPKPNWYSSN